MLKMPKSYFKIDIVKIYSCNLWDFFLDLAISDLKKLLPFLELDLSF